MWSLLATALLFIGPMLLYWYFNLKGMLPNQNEWLGNHGPWRFAWPYIYIYWSWVALLAMIPSIIILGCTLAYWQKNRWNVVRGALLSVLSMVFAYIQLTEILWTVD